MNKEIFDDLGRAISSAADTIGRKTGELVEITRLKNQIYNLERGIKKDYTDLGKMIYERYMSTGTTEESLLPICEEIAQKEILIQQYGNEIDSLKEE
ncbi:MAG: hypothetical protein HFJ10_02010 [Lachnospiraceae bacterium]|jgi:hypothetical protein|nr:hypothetical protein [Lachnospiraceae bacterium]